MDVLRHDYNAIEKVFKERKQESADIDETLKNMPLYVKASDQKGLKGSAIFDPVGTNGHLKEEFKKRGWATNERIPKDFKFLGTDIDYIKKGIIVEAQFSNYPFLLNNLLRTELFLKSKLKLAGEQIKALVVITKARVFPASNSTLYYEQAKFQLDALVKHGVFQVPIRLIGIHAETGEEVQGVWTRYSDARYSRTISERKKTPIDIIARGKGRARLQLPSSRE